ncbi:bacterio-opsin activator [Halobacteriales archaeon SW_6_65_15]|nr:MAG: bacterio-opsin activator [Halobacteriales archaeon SW_6_65_15]
MSLIAEFSLRSPDLVLVSALDAAPGVTVELEQQLVTAEDAPLLVFWAFGGDFEKLETGLERRLGASPMAATGSADGWQRRVRFPDRDSIVEMRQFCADNDVNFRLHRLYAPGESDVVDEFGLSPEQRRALMTAERVGYFDVPREVSLDDLGEELDISGQSASERLRRGISELVSNTLLSDL